MSSDTTPPPAPLLLDRIKAGKVLGVSAGTIDNLRLRGELPSVKLGTRRLYSTDDLAALIAKKREVAP
jgi:hypothetical protein